MLWKCMLDTFRMGIVYCHVNANLNYLSWKYGTNVNFSLQHLLLLSLLCCLKGTWSKYKARMCYCKSSYTNNDSEIGHHLNVWKYKNEIMLKRTTNTFNMFSNLFKSLLLLRNICWIRSTWEYVLQLPFNKKIHWWWTGVEIRSSQLGANGT